MFFKFANVRGIDDGYEMFLFTKEHKLEMNDVFLNINSINILLQNKFSDIYRKLKHIFHLRPCLNLALK